MANTPYFMTGALGCIGAWVVKALVERGDVPVVFDRSDDTRRLRLLLDEASLGRVRFLRGDVTDASAVRTALAESRAQRVIHLAGLQVPTCKADPALGAMVNVVGTINVFEAARALGLPRVVYASSAAVFGLADEAVDETVSPSPLTHYGVFKQANEGNARVYFADHGVSSVGLRPFSVYGVGRDAGLTSDPDPRDQVGGGRASVPDPFQRRDRLHLHRGYGRGVHCLRRRRARRRARVQPSRRRPERRATPWRIVEDEIGPARARADLDRRPGDPDAALARRHGAAD